MAFLLVSVSGLKAPGLAGDSVARWVANLE
jgi:hypothetical protein